MNGLESRYAALLQVMLLTGEILAYEYEMIKLGLSHHHNGVAGVNYTPDFFVDYGTHMEFHEVKGFWRDDAKVKLSVAAHKYPQFRFKAVQWRKKTGWVITEY